MSDEKSATSTTTCSTGYAAAVATAAKDASRGADTATNSLSPPSDTDKDPFSELSFKVGVAENKNVTYRATMEDVHTYVANFAEQLDWGYFAIFDGHAGKQTARWCGNNLHTLLEKEITSAEASASPASAPPSGHSDVREHLHRAFIRADELIPKEHTGSSGCTAAVAVLRWETAPTRPESAESHNEVSPRPPRQTSSSAGSVHSSHRRMLYTSNVGDSRIVLCRRGRPFRLSYDHKATDVHEINRIRESGGLIMKNRVNGVLAVTRSLGDTYMKDLVIGKPYTTATEICADDEFMILACDGLWDVISDQAACDFIRKMLRQNPDPAAAAKMLCQLAMDSSTTDNVTVMVVTFDGSVFGLGEAVKKMRVSS
ncbi:PPM-type phosphatase domain-containing protein [[Candida] zeylanoides]